MSESTESVVLAEGKYTVILEQNPWRFYALRYNLPWVAGERLDNLHLALFQEIRNLHDENRRRLQEYDI